MNERIGNYDIITETRQLTIQWNKVYLLRRERHKLRMALPPPFDKIHHQSTGTILGKEIRMTGILKKSSNAKNCKSASHMETSSLQTTKEQGGNMED